jgi:hypothetical protein
VRFHQDFRNSTTRVSKALCHYRLIAASVIAGDFHPYRSRRTRVRPQSRQTGRSHFGWAGRRRPRGYCVPRRETERHFEQLVVGPAAMTLDDGEVATIADALSVCAGVTLRERFLCCGAVVGETG